MTHNVFVFGTLKRGQPNFYLLEDAGNGLAVYLADGVTEEKFPVVIASSCNIPFMLPVAGKGKNVVGEIYKVDDSMLNRLDILERKAEILDRREINVVSNGCTITCWCYHLVNHKKELQELPTIDNYDTNGSHGLPYIPNSLETCDNFSDVQIPK
ncbi:gamma-glutamylaminecyclotransferase C-like [Mytilus galloprovincialis]|uniref:Gamma-glutamylcyclotransferase family protein n=1 Tax=Mytilus edulis TaxID=6550 RepID=A0A8S3Q3U4_MYTED|nr:GGACT [Mytilus edulis]